MSQPWRPASKLDEVNLSADHAGAPLFKPA
jgi:hypothetical protein